MILLDTDMVTLLHGPPSAARDRLLQQLETTADAGEDVVVSIISFEEQMRGWLAHISRAKDPVKQVGAYDRLHRLLNQYSGMRILDFDEPASSRFANLRTAHRRANTMDLKIAAVAIVHGAALLSGNARDFAGIPGLTFEAFQR
jgi:tRNA(fMet)-specific endonuclease VapC